jgi:hypothetical protein
MTRIQLFVSLLGVSGCSTPHMVVPREIAGNAEVIEATDRSSWSGALADESFKLGPYAITDVDRDWNSTSAVSLLGFSEKNTEGGYAFKVKRGGTDVAGGCVTEAIDNSVEFGVGFSAGRNFAKLGCTCGGESSSVKVVIAASTGKSYEGQLTTRKGSYRVEAIYEAEGVMSTGEPMGYRVDGESAIGAVEVLKPGRAYFKKGLDLEEHADLACLYAGLLLYETPKER